MKEVLKQGDEGNYEEYEADKKRRLGEEAAKPHRLRFKPLKR